ncbi:hypothetical protein WA026_008519 [Henosepilachna vigintioctopunctata]|uniref:Osiris 5 n=1 Tax=Henosepilachna vigintioctopunctata TaxID=420089 RepID=A0AAW1UIR7_9CUCU
MSTKLILLVSLCVFSMVSVKCASDGIDFGKGTHVLGKFFIHFLDSQPEDVKLSEGVHLVSVKSASDARSMKQEKSVLGAVEDYLQNHEIRIRFPELMPGEEFGRSFKEAIDDIDESNEVVTGRRKNGGGGGNGGGGMGNGVMVVGVMMGKLLATLGIAGVALLAKKALFVSALALILSVIIGLKKLVHSDDHDSGHTVIHASHGHGHDHHDYRKKREAANIAFRGWESFKNEEKQRL